MNVLVPLKAERYRLSIVSCATLLIDVPIGIQETQVDNTDICSVAFYFLDVPQWERIIITIGEENCIWLTAVEICLSNVACRISVATVVIVPVFCCHTNRHGKHGYTHNEVRSHHWAHLGAQGVPQTKGSNTNPDGVGIEGTNEGIITFARLVRLVVGVNYNG